MDLLMEVTIVHDVPILNVLFNILMVWGAVVFYGKIILGVVASLVVLAFVAFDCLLIPKFGVVDVVIWNIKMFFFGLLVLARYPLAMILVLFFSSEDKLTLTVCRAIEAIDNPLTGDSGWREEHLWGTDPLSYRNRVRWLWRNGFNKLAYTLFGTKLNDPSQIVTLLKDDTHTQAYVGHYFLYRTFIKFGNRYLELFLGYNLFGPQEYQGDKYVKIVCSPRGRTSTN